MRFSWGKILYERFIPCKTFDIMKLWFHIAILNDLGVDGALPQARLILVEHDGHRFQFRLSQRGNLQQNYISQPILR